MRFFTKRFEQVAEDYLRESALYSRNARTARSCVRVLLRYFRGRPITDIKPHEIQDMIAARLGEGVTKGTVNRQRAALNRIFNMAIAQGLHRGPNPVKVIRPFREAPGRARYLSLNEVRGLTRVAPRHLRNLMMAALYTGGRLSELLALRWNDIDLQGGFVYFRRESTKSSKQRVVPIADELRKILERIGPGPIYGPVFTVNGQGFKSVRSSFRRARRIAGLPDIRFHDLRHTFSAWYVQKGGDLYRLQKYLGHSTIDLTQRYAHLSPEYLKDGLEYFGPPRKRRR